jgi:3-hydroxybutyryl-CoA dehydratase
VGYGLPVKGKSRRPLSFGFEIQGGMRGMLKKVAVGDTLPVIEKEIDQERILRWARVSGDFNRLHVDPEFAGQTRFAGTIAHGPMSLAFLNELMLRCFGMGWARGGKLLEVRFAAPIRPGDRVRITGTVKQVQESSVECDLVVEKRDGEKAVVGRAVGILEPEGK